VLVRDGASTSSSAASMMPKAAKDRSLLAAVIREGLTDALRILLDASRCDAARDMVYTETMPKQARFGPVRSLLVEHSSWKGNWVARRRPVLWRRAVEETAAVLRAASPKHMSREASRKLALADL